LSLMQWRKSDLEKLRALASKVSLEKDAPLLVLALPTERGISLISGQEALYIYLRDKIEGK